MIANLMRKSVQLVPWKYRHQIKDWPLIGPAQRWVVGRFFASGRFLHTVNAGPAEGLRIWIELPKDKPLWTGTYEADFSAALSRAVESGDVCLDIGGYRGFFSGLCALSGASAVHIFEPLPANISRIQSLIEANPSLPLVLHAVAVGAKVGESEFVVMPEASMGKLHDSRFRHQATRGETLRVQVETLDHLRGVGLIPAPNVIKIDVEGAEAFVLLGARNTLATARPKLFIEVHTRELAKECLSILSELAYEVNVLETLSKPDFVTEPEVCHFVAKASASSSVMLQK